MLNISNSKVDDELADLQLYSLKTLRTPGLSVYLARVLIIMMGIAVISLFLPWQQNIRGTGKLTALNPANRPQTIQSAIPGRIKKWYVYEGQFVNAGDTLLSLSEIKDKFFDPELLNRTQEQIEAKESSLLAKELKREAYRNQIQALKESLVAKMMQARNKVRQSELKLQSDSIAFDAEQVAFQNQSNIFERNRRRYESGNITLTKFQELESKFNMSMSKVVSAENKVLEAQASLAINRTDLSAIQADYAEKISKATSDLQATLSDINDTQASIAKLKNEYSNIQIRTEQYQVIAPQSGYVVQALKVGIGETIKEGEAIATIMPSNPDKAVEIYIQAMDVPLVSAGRKVRIQFDGWPALQFSGWPNVSVGTFGGIVQVIDRTNSREGLFRILVIPDPNDDEWPEQLRLGQGIKGWVMLDNVAVWYEIWRQLNGFPPDIYNPGEAASSDTKNSSEKK